MSERPQRVLISDLGNVLLYFDRARTYRAIAELAACSATDVARVIESSGIRERYEQDPTAFASATDFLKALRTLLEDAGIGPVCGDAQLEDAWCALFWENRAVHRIVRHVKEVEGLPLLLLSDTNEIHYEYFRRRYHDIHAMFDAAIVSFRAGVSKEKDAPAILRLALGEARALVPGIPSRHVLYIDDREEFTAAAITLGIDAHVYRTNGDLVGWLESRGYSIPERVIATPSD